MGQSPSSEADSRPVRLEMSRLLWNPNVHYLVHNSPPPVHILSQINPVHTIPPYFFKIHFNIILPLKPRSSESSLPFRLPNPNFVLISYLPCA
jgi:hypothetical protein